MNWQRDLYSEMCLTSEVIILRVRTVFLCLGRRIILFMCKCSWWCGRFYLTCRKFAMGSSESPTSMDYGLSGGRLFHHWHGRTSALFCPSRPPSQTSAHMSAQWCAAYSPIYMIELKAFCRPTWRALFLYSSATQTVACDSLTEHWPEQ